MSKKKKILIVEDEQVLKITLKKKFLKDGFDIVEASDGEEGLEVAEKEKPDLILLDIVMPKMDGMTMLRKLRQRKFGKEMPVILLTNLADTDEVNRAMELNVFDYLVKSNWDIEDVIGKVKVKLGV